MKTKYRRRQRGVVLLVVLSLLTLFTLLLVTFIIVAGQYRQSALSAARVSRVNVSPAKLLDNATFTLLRDSTDPGNAIRFHSLFFDMYGGDGFVGEIATNGVQDVGGFAAGTDGTGGNFFDLRIQVQAPSPLPPATPTTPGEPLDFADTYYPLSFVEGYYNGCVLTVVSSRVAQGRSFRVVDYQAAPAAMFPDPTQHVFRLMPIAFSHEASSVRPVAGDRVILNGRPFNGTGFGYDTGAASTDPQLDPNYALQPNQFQQTSSTELANFVAGDADESYDAVDFQNMALAGIIPTSTTLALDGIVVVPSFHRPELVNYWFATDTTKLPRAIMRPMPWDHPDFDGSNRELTLPRGYTAIQRDQFLSKLAGVNPLDPTKRINPWDVDNDGDRIPDSVWVDLGFPNQTTADGRQVRPLFAFLCTDLDGRINLNAAGSTGQVAGYWPASIPTTNLARRAASSSLPRGQGLGPAEINPKAGSDPLFTNAQLRAMIESRYGANQRPGTNGVDTFASVKLFEFPTDYFNGTSSKAFNSPPDLFGDLAFGIDYRGQPVYETPNATRTDLLSNSPYEFDVTSLQRGRADEPFTVAELERVLRHNDATARQLPERLTNLGGISGSDSRRRSVTTDSYDVPVPPVVSLSELRSSFEAATDWQTQFPSYNSGRPLHVTDLLAARLSAGGVLQAEINAEIAKMLSFDLRAGTRMDVNRPFGNGQDDNGNNVVDEHGPTSAQQLEADPSVAEQVWAAGTRFDHDNDGNTGSDTNAFLARHHFAKHLFALAMTLKEGSQSISFDGDGPNPTEETARGLAQWAINVVDFRDADSIMTPFEYDMTPFNGWDVDGHITTDDSTFGTDGIDNDGDGTADEQDEIDRAARAMVDRKLVWGCERPELLIKETVALHDRRTEDLRTDPTGNDTNDPSAPDNDFDQRLQPRGATFVELYNPWSGEAKKPAEFYSDGAALRDGVVLNKRAPTVIGGALNGAPVWRIIVVAGVSHGPPVLDPDDPASGFVQGNVERGIYFVNPSSLPPDPSWTGTGASGHGVQRHFPNGPVAELRPGRYAVVGTEGFNDGAGNFITAIGRRTDAEDDGQTLMTNGLKLDQTRRIVLSPSSNPNIHQVQVLDNGLSEPTTPEILPAIAVALNRGFDTGSGAVRALNFSVSEPPNGYPLARAGSAWDPTQASAEGSYVPPLDQPLDDVGLGRAGDIVTALDLDPETTSSDRNTHSVNLRTLHLQRLANPLLPYNATTNPYRTIDQAPLDLTVFEGVYDPNDPNVSPPSPRTNPNVRFGSRQRGQLDSGSVDGRKLWNSGEQLQPRPLQVADAHIFNYRLDHSLGFLNRSYGARYGTASVASLPLPAQYVGSPNSESGNGHPFPWLTWNNRPFVSQHEMMLVPHSRSSRLLRDFSIVDTGSPPNIYNPASSPRQFGHLLNFFSTTYFDTGMSTWVPGPNLYRLFDYTHVPSRFMGTETWLDTTTFASGNGTEFLHPPFDRVSSFREPGKPNINTIFEQRVWDAIRGSNSTLQGFSSLIDSRRGYGSAGSDAVLLDATVPTFFGNPFRAADTGDLVPVDSMKRAGVESTLLRSTALTATTTQTQKDGGFAVTTGGIHVEPNRNPYFRYQNMQRLSNLVTTRSNVYAIWVTMGMFEVNIEDSGGGVYVERLGQEAGRETGNVKRHRAFYIVDRSIPVAFEPGENHNIDHAILSRRIIE